MNDGPFHAGELAAQKRAGAVNVASWASRIIRDHMPQQHRDFHTSLPFIILSAADKSGKPWITALEGEEGFIASPDDRTLIFNTLPDPHDPLFQSMSSGTDIGMLGIQFATRRRNRMSGFIRRHDRGLQLNVRQTFGNCPQYIQKRDWSRDNHNVPGKPRSSKALTSEQLQHIESSDTLFIGSGQRGEDGAPSNGYDASHRGGKPGFVEVLDKTHLRIPDYSGNNFFNTIGNLIENPSLGLLFLDFATGGMLQISGKGSIDWEPRDALDPEALRVIDVTIEAVIERPNALSLRWQASRPT